MQMPRQHQVVSTLASGCPDRRVVCAQNSNIAFGGGNRVRPRNRNDARAMPDANRGLVNPFAAAADHGVTNAMHAHGSIMVAADRQNTCIGLKDTNQVA